MNTDTKTTNYLLQFEARPNLALAWPVRITVDGVVTHGRPDAFHLIGFQKYKHVQHMDLTLADAISGTSPVGMYAVYSSTDGSGLFAVLEKVATFEAVGA